MRFETGCSIPAEHPTLPHHFPGNPVVPGAVILTEVIRALAAGHPGHWVRGIPRVRFSLPLRCEEPFTIAITLTGPLSADFECRSHRGVVALGSLDLAPAGEAP